MAWPRLGDKENCIVLTYQALYFQKEDFKMLLPKGFIWEENRRAMVHEACAPKKGKKGPSIWSVDCPH